MDYGYLLTLAIIGVAGCLVILIIDFYGKRKPNKHAQKLGESEEDKGDK